MSSTSNEDILRKVRGLLAKAEGTDNPHEAEAFSAKAEEMIARYGVDIALVEATTENKGKPTMRTYPIPDGYGKAKTILLNVIVTNHSCKMIRSMSDKTLMVVGYQSDLDMVDMLFTSLLLQGSHALLSAHRSDRAFRTSFWYGFASRTGKRLEAIRVKVAKDNEVSTALVLRDRQADVDQAFKEAFPRTRSTAGGRASSADGYGAGQAAADRSNLGQHAVGNRGSLR